MNFSISSYLDFTDNEIVSAHEEELGINQRGLNTQDVRFKEQIAA